MIGIFWVRQSRPNSSSDQVNAVFETDWSLPIIFTRQIDAIHEFFAQVPSVQGDPHTNATSLFGRCYVCSKEVHFDIDQSGGAELA